jgi:hypothetical protein
VVGLWRSVSAEALRDCAERVEGERLGTTALQEAHGFLGLAAERGGDRARAAAHYRQVVELGDTGWLLYAWSFARLAQWGERPVHRSPRRSEVEPARSALSSWI